MSSSSGTPPSPTWMASRPPARISLITWGSAASRLTARTTGAEGTTLTGHSRRSTCSSGPQLAMPSAARRACAISYQATPPTSDAAGRRISACPAVLHPAAVRSAACSPGLGRMAARACPAPAHLAWAWPAAGPVPALGRPLPAWPAPAAPVPACPGAARPVSAWPAGSERRGDRRGNSPVRGVAAGGSVLAGSPAGLPNELGGAVSTGRPAGARTRGDGARRRTGWAHCPSPTFRTAPGHGTSPADRAGCTGGRDRLAAAAYSALPAIACQAARVCRITANVICCHSLLPVTEPRPVPADSPHYPTIRPQQY